MQLLLKQLFETLVPKSWVGQGSCNLSDFCRNYAHNSTVKVIFGDFARPSVKFPQPISPKPPRFPDSNSHNLLFVVRFSFC